MKNVKSRLLALMIAVCACNAGMLSAGCPVSGNELIAKGHEFQSTTHATLIHYTPVSQQAGGTYQVGILDPHGKLHMDEKNPRIDILNPGGPRFIKIEGPLPTGTYQLVVYMKERNDTLPVNMTNLIQDISIVRGNHRAFVKDFADETFVGNPANTVEREMSYFTFCVFDPKHPG